MQDSEGASESSYSSSITTIAVAQICQSAGFAAAQKPALNTLTDIATRYLQAIAKSAASSAASFRRTQSNAFDIVLALEHLQTTQGFPGSSQTNVESVLASSLLLDLERFLIFTDEIPFAKPLQKSVGAGWLGLDNGGVVGDGVRPNHVPRWLPLMPGICDEVEVEEEGKWEEGSRFRNEDREEVEERRIELRGKRGEGKERVRKGMGSSVCRSGGFGKRVLCQSNWKSGGDDGVEKNRVMVSFKKRLK